MPQIENGENLASVREKINQIDTAVSSLDEFYSSGTISEMASRSDVSNDDVVKVKSAFNGEPEDFAYDASSTLTENGSTVIEATGIGTGRWISKRAVYASFDEFVEDVRTFDVGAFIEVPSIGGKYSAVSSSGSLGQANAGGQEFDVKPVNGMISLAAFNYSPSTAADSLLTDAAAAARKDGCNQVFVPGSQITVNAYPDLGDDITLVADGCDVVGGVASDAFPRAKQVIGFRQSGITVGQYANIPPLQIKSSSLKCFYSESASKVWAIYPKAFSKGGFAQRLRSTGAGALSGPNDAGGDNERIRRDLQYNLSYAWCQVGLTDSSRVTESGTWSDNNISASQFRQADGGANLLASQAMRRNTSAGGDYIEVEITTDPKGRFNVGLYCFSSASDSVEIKDQTNNIVIDAALDLRAGSGESAHQRIFEYTAPKSGTFTVRITNNGSTQTDLRVLGLNIQEMFQDHTAFNELETYDAFNFIRQSASFLSTNSAATPVFSARVDGSVITAGSIHGGETRNSVSWVVDGEEWFSGVSPDDGAGGYGVFKMGKSLKLRQENTLLWSDGQTAKYHEELDFNDDGWSCTWAFDAAANVQISNIYATMMPMDPSVNTIIWPVKTDLGAAGASDVLFNQSVHGENCITFEASATGERYECTYTTYPESQVRGKPGGSYTNRAATTDGYTKFYGLLHLGANIPVAKSHGRHIIREG